MLDISLSISTISDDRLTATLLDSTVFGGANPARSAVGVYVIVQKLDSTTAVTETLVATGDDGTPQTDSSWTFPLTPGDGWYRILYIAPEDYDAGDTYALYDCVQDPATSIVYRSKQNGNIAHALSDTSWWEVVTALVALNNGAATESVNLNSTVYSVILTPNAEYEYANAISEAGDICCSDNCDLEQLFVYIKLGALLDAMYVCSDRAEYPQAEIIARRFQSIIESLS